MCYEFLEPVPVLLFFVEPVNEKSQALTHSPRFNFKSYFYSYHLGLHCLPKNQFGLPHKNINYVMFIAPVKPKFNPYLAIFSPENAVCILRLLHMFKLF